MEPKRNSRLWFIFVAISILLSSILFGTYKRTLSSTLGEIEHKSVFARGFCDMLELILNDEDHCLKEFQDYLNEVKK